MCRHCFSLGCIHCRERRLENRGPKRARRSDSERRELGLMPRSLHLIAPGSPAPAAPARPRRMLQTVLPRGFTL